jgi:predicted ester cyclase
MSVAENKAIIRHLFEAMNQQNLGIIDELFSTDFVNHSPRIATVDREGTMQDWVRFFMAFPDWQTIIEDLIAEDDRVVVRRTVHGTHKGDIPGISMPPTRKRVTFTVWDMFRIAGGKIVERWGMHDLRQQLGAVTV